MKIKVKEYPECPKCERPNQFGDICHHRLDVEKVESKSEEPKFIISDWLGNKIGEMK